MTAINNVDIFDKDYKPNNIKSTKIRPELNFENLSNNMGLPLYGDKYKIIRKLFTYAHVGMLGVNLPILYASLNTDMRISCIFDMPPDSGKKDIKVTSESICKGTGCNFESPAPGFHEEQLIGVPAASERRTVLSTKGKEKRKGTKTKTTTDKKTTTDNDDLLISNEIEDIPEPTEIRESSEDYKVIERLLPEHRGYLSLDMLVFDEATPILTTDKHCDSRHYIKISQDTYGDSKLSKWRLQDRTDVKNGLKFPSPTTIIICLQPNPIDKLPVELLNEGFMRRFFITTVRLTEEDKYDIVRRRTDPTYTTNHIILERTQMIEWYRVIKDRISRLQGDSRITFEGGIGRSLANFCIKDLTAISKTRGLALKQYTIDSMNTLTNKLLAMSCIRNIVDKGDGLVRIRDLSNAFDDLKEIWEQQLNFIAKYFELDKYEIVMEEDEVQPSIYAILHEHINEETAMDYDVFLGELMNLYGGKSLEYTRRRHFCSLRREGIIDSTMRAGKKIEGKKYKVWLTGKKK